ncbi:hypothetical protein AtubIFM55763_010034 [Aspergillus tubingensis]|uniref:AP endonuclease, family 2 n=2 Tax=Aspergillus subgen. Circumdati TaxID=2720871 RepID=A0A124BW60_ASPNG|nr:AP endonuclease, family 2 [Aspergillus tubingensis]GAQ38271.1 AP endonuclease, family 2 [Aspergillus niger]GFN13372.1 AP endonuclease, family 2 [Aspergillus tubingensis]GLA77843.1 hypothetical protein AtubIFM55763_010034 [Aspergillus tubingensis]GLA81963.1 hypothetical protein AtubIFM56815_006142 [Aspergillus tubingensis]GLA92989.1 hypothetical protein AtubIFM57143_009968 [Aspergillus tubingensis]
MSSLSSPLTPCDRLVSIPCRRYSADATLLLVGFVGAGKKTLGIIASVALRRRFIDFDAVFRQEVHLSPQEYIAQHGPARYRELELKLTRTLLEKCSTGCVITITGVGWSANRQQQVLLKEFAQNHPVVYVRRDRADLQQFIMTTSPDKFNRIFEAGNEFFQSCSSFDFFNHTQEKVTDYAGRPLPAYIKLKEAERVFLRFLHQVFGRAFHVLYSSDPFSPSHTYALQVPLTWLENNPDLGLLESGTDAVNLVIDGDAVDFDSGRFMERIAKHMATVRKHTRVPIFIEVPQQSSPRCCELLEMLLRLAPDVVACSVDSPDFSRLKLAKGHTKIIATYQSTSMTGNQSIFPEVRSLLEKTDELDFDAFRITSEPNFPGDLTNLNLQKRLGEITDIPITAYHTGPLGRASICLNPILSPVILPSLPEGDIGVTLASAQQALTSCYLLTKQTFTVFGQRVQNSLSPAMHNAAYTACGLPHTYNILCSDRFSDIHKLLNSTEHGGVAVTLPYKTDVLTLLDEVSPDAQDIHAVNTVVIQRSNNPSSKILKGYNTDYLGIRDCIYKHLSPANAIRHGTTALIIGAGGMARAAIYACYQIGVRQMCIYNRTSSNAQKLAEYYTRWAEKKNTRLQIEVLRSGNDPWPVGFRQPTIIVTCLPAPAGGQLQAPVTMEISEQWLRSTTGGVFVDVAYGMPQTKLRMAMNERSSMGWVVVDGLVVLLEQGIAQYELFTGRPAPVHVMRGVLREYTNAVT